MKKTEIVCVGKIKENFIKEGIAEYAKRIERYARFSVTELPDCAVPSQAVETESSALLSKLDGFVILLDLRGREISSEELSAEMDRAFLSCTKIQFVIGGSTGVNDAVRKRADVIIRFGKVTYPHMLMRLILTEQIYRALSISAGLPYHK